MLLPNKTVSRDGNHEVLALSYVNLASGSGESTPSQVLKGAPSKLRLGGVFCGRDSDVSARQSAARQSALEVVALRRPLGQTVMYSV